jgi:hypothetical protein
MKRSTRILAGSLALGLMAASAPAQAGQGTGVIDSKQVEGGTVVVGGTTFRVSDGTALEDKDGNAITFAALPTVAQGASVDDAAAWFEATDSEAQMPVLHRLKLTGAVPD